jgi:hypothetical protein
MMENVDRRVLAGFVCVDAITSSSIAAPLAVTTLQLVLRRNRHNTFAVMNVIGVASLSELTDDFLAPTAAGSWPPPKNYEITIQDPALQYLSRRANIAAPQPLPAAAPVGTTTTTTSAPTTTVQAGVGNVPPVTTPQQIALYPTASASLALNWAVVRVAVTGNNGSPLPWVVVQVTGSGNPTATGVTDTNGQALLAVPGLGLTLSSSSSGSVTETTTAATVTAWFDPATAGQPSGWVSNPDDILLKLATPDPSWKSASQAIQLGPGLTISIALTIPM